MSLITLPNEILHLIFSHLGLRQLARLSSACDRLRLVAEDLLYTRAVEEDKTFSWPVSLTIAAISGRVHAFNCLLEKTEWPLHEGRRSTLFDHPITRAWIESYKDYCGWELDNITLLHLVSHLGNEEMVKLVLERHCGEKCNTRYPVHDSMLYDGGRRTPLHRAAEMGHIPTMKLLLAAGARINERDRGGASAALDYAIETRHNAAVEFLVHAGADVMAGCREEPHITPLVRACSYGSQYLANFLIRSGARKDIDNALWAVVPTDELSMAQLLLEAGARPGPIHLERTARFASMEMLQLLMKNGAKFDSNENSRILHDGGCSPEMAQLILNEIPEVANSRDSSGLTPLDTIYRANLSPFKEDAVTSLALQLIKAGGEVSGLDRNFDVQKTTLQSAALRGHERMVRILLQLESQKPLISTTDDYGRTALRLACQSAPPNLTIAELLIEAGIDVQTEAPNGTTTLHAAVSHRALKLIPLLIRAGVDVSHQDFSGETALHMVARQAMRENKRIQGYANLAGAIILGDMDVTVQDVGGERRLEAHMRTDYIEVIRVLVAAGIDVSLPDHHGYTALDVIAKQRVPGSGGALNGNKKLKDLKGAGQTAETRGPMLEWISGCSPAPGGPDNAADLGGFWEGIEGVQT